MSERLGDQPIEPKLEDMMNALARGINEVLNEPGQKKNGFCLMVFPFEGFEGRANYISNASRKDIIVLLKEQLARFQGQPDIKGRA